MLKGQCLCGAVTWEIRGELSALLHCHCSFCRKSHGSSFATYGAVKSDDLSFTGDQANIGSYSVTGHMYRKFCRLCGSVVPFEEAGSTSVPVGNLLDPCPTIAVGHIFVNSLAPWYRITDDLKQYQEFPSSMQREPVTSPPCPTTDHLNGSCLCGQVSFEVTEPPLGMMNCHCDRCKRSRSAAHATNLFVPESGFRWLSGDDQVRQYKLPEAERFGSAFCNECGSLMPRVIAGAGRINIPAGNLNSDPGVTPAAHIYSESQANWFTITDDLPRYERSMPRR